MTQIQKQIETKTENESVRENKNKRKIKFQFSQMVFNKIIIVVILLAGVSYILCVNDLSIKGIKMNELKKSNNNLTLENNELELEIMNLKSFASISERAKTLSLVPAGKKVYLKADSVLVVNK